MALINPKKIITEAQKAGYAIPAFNVHNLETVQAVVNGAARLKSPVIIATTPGTVKHAGIESISAIVRVYAEKNDIPITLHMDHCEDYGLLEECARNGYTSMMIDASKLSYQDNISITKKVVTLGGKYGMCVEAELGKIGGVEDDLLVDEAQALMTVPEEALDFVVRTVWTPSPWQ